MRLLTLLTLVFLCSACGGGAQKTSVTKIWIFAGQSNCVGGGHFMDLSAVQQAPDDRVPAWWANNETATYPEHSNGWTTLRPQQRDTVATAASEHFGPELAFGHALAERGEKVAVAKWAVNGTSLALRWTADLYPLMRDGVRGALADYPEDYELAGLVWVQGEGDAWGAPTADVYAENLATLVGRIRSDLNAPDLHVVVTRLNSHMDRPKLDTVRAQQAQFVAEDSNATLIDTDSLALWDQGASGPADDIHYDSASQLTLGQLIANVVP